MPQNNNSRGVNPSIETFSTLLSEATKQIAYLEHKPQKQLLKEIGAEINVSPSTIEYWKQKHWPQTHQNLVELAFCLMKRGYEKFDPDLKRFDRDWMWNFLFHGNHPNPEEICKQWFLKATEKRPIADDSDETRTESPRTLHDIQTETDPYNALKNELSEPTERWIRLGRLLLKSLVHTMRKIPKWVSVTIVLFSLLGVFLPTLQQIIVTKYWAISITENTDDINIILLNGHIHHYQVKGQMPKWIAIPISPNPQEIILANLNGAGGATWDFTIQYDGKVLQNFRDPPVGNTIKFGLPFTQKIWLLPNGELVEDEKTIPVVNNPDEWHIDFQAGEFGLILINGNLVAGTYPSGNGIFPVFKVSNHIIPGQTNKIALIVWHWKAEKELFWEIDIQKNGESVWNEENLSPSWSEKQKKGEVFYQEFEIDPNGNLTEK
ncbi:MAG: hypothetical protein Fur0022_13230 [Anaerolineales bacterium]